MKQFLLSLLLLVGVYASAQHVPEKIAFQGYLTDMGGNPVITTTAVRFGIYIGSTRYWYAEYSSVTFNAGRFSVFLGSTDQGGQALDPVTGVAIGNVANLPIRSGLLVLITTVLFPGRIQPDRYG